MNMKKNALITTLLLSATCLVTKADVPVFGNSPNGTGGFNIIVYNTSMDIGAAVVVCATILVSFQKSLIFFKNF